MEFSKKLAMLMDKARMSQQDVANAIGLQQSRISKWTTNKGEPSLQQAVKLSKLFGVSLDYLADDDIDEPPAPPDTASIIVMQLIQDMGYEEARRRLAQVPEIELLGKPAPGSPRDPSRNKPGSIRGAG